jgi:phosphotransferase system  glucose/maltose/N-acetylglucosamine-specific IIC component
MMKDIAQAFFLIVGIVVVLGLLFSYPVMLLWNGCLVPAVDGVKEIGWLQAWGLMILFGILFKTTATKK